MYSSCVNSRFNTQRQELKTLYHKLATLITIHSCKSSRLTISALTASKRNALYLLNKEAWFIREWRVSWRAQSVGCLKKTHLGEARSWKKSSWPPKMSLRDKRILISHHHSFIWGNRARTKRRLRIWNPLIVQCIIRKEGDRRRSETWMFSHTIRPSSWIARTMT